MRSETCGTADSDWVDFRIAEDHLLAATGATDFVTAMERLQGGIAMTVGDEAFW